MENQVLEWAGEFLNLPRLTDEKSRQLLSGFLSNDNVDFQWELYVYWNGYQKQQAPPGYYFRGGLKQKLDSVQQAYTNFYELAGLRQLATVIRRREIDEAKPLGDVVFPHHPEGGYYPMRVPPKPQGVKALWESVRELEVAKNALWAIYELLNGHSTQAAWYRGRVYENTTIKWDPQTIPMLRKMMEQGLYDPSSDLYTGP